MVPAPTWAGTTTTVLDRFHKAMKNERSDLYAVLGVLPTATQTEISHAYRALLRKHHPDTRAGVIGTEADPDDALRQVIAAYAVLRDATRRAEYDRTSLPRIRPVASQVQQAPTDCRRNRQPPIVAGPVRWYPNPPHPPA